MYYLQSRYYDPEVGRFLNSDVFAATGQGLLGNNMFAYCLNNPVCCYDPGGTMAFYTFLGDNHVFSSHALMGGCGGGGSYGAAFAYSYIRDAHGDFVLAEGHGDPVDNHFGAEIYAEEISMHYDFLSITNDGVTFIDTSVHMLRGNFSWHDGIIGITPVDYFGAELNAGISLTKGVNFCALAYLCANSVILDFGFIEISGTAYIGAIGAEFALNPGELTVGAAPNGIGASVTVKWDVE